MDSEQMTIFHNSTANINQIARWLINISDAMIRLNMPIGQEIDKIATELHRIADTIDKAITSSINQELKNSQGRSALILEAALSGIKIAIGKKNANLD